MFITHLLNYLVLLFTALATPIASAPPQHVLAKGPVAPTWKHQFTSYLNVDTETHRFSAISEGTRVNVDFRGGNFTAPDGSLLANIIPNLGGEHGYVDASGIFHMTIRYTVQFVHDGKWGYVQSDGFGIFGSGNPVRNVRLYTTIETDSLFHSELVTETLFSQSNFIEDSHWLVSDHFSPKVSVKQKGWN